MTPVTIPTPAGPCFAAYHPAPGPAVLFVPMFGYEALSTSRIWVHFADRLAAHGTAVLRLDLPGTGDSAGAIDQPNPVAAWQSAIDASAAWLTARHGPISLLGCRFGALLALDAAGRGLPCRALILLDPPADGAGMVRQLRARARLKSAGGGEGDGALQAYGIPLGGDMLTGLSILPATAFTQTNVLLLQDNPAAPPKWLAALQTSGARIETAGFPGREAFVMRDSFRLEPPTEAFDAIATFLAAQPASESPPTTPPSPAQLHLPGLTETPVHFAENLFGILSKPDHPAALAVLIPSVGNLPRSGPQRMMTDLARALAAHGVATLRYDCACVGDSAGEPTGDPAVETYAPYQLRHVSLALDELARHGFHHAIIIGHCSGAYLAWHAATDPRVAGIFAANLQTLHRMDRAEASRTVRPGGEGPGPFPASLPDSLPDTPAPTNPIARARTILKQAIPRPLWTWLRTIAPSEIAVRRHLRRLVARGCRVRLVYGTLEDERYRLHRAFNEPPRLPRGADIVLVEGADHMFSARRHREQLMQLAVEFVSMHESATNPEQNR